MSHIIWVFCSFLFLSFLAAWYALYSLAIQLILNLLFIFQHLFFPSLSVYLGDCRCLQPSTGLFAPQASLCLIQHINRGFLRANTFSMGVVFRQGFPVRVFPLFSITLSQVCAFYSNNGALCLAAQSYLCYQLCTTQVSSPCLLAHWAITLFCY